MDKYKKIAIITGASSGLGREFAYQIDNNREIDEIWLCARRSQRLNDLSAKLQHPTKIIAGCVCDYQWQDKLRKKLNSDKVKIHTLINSAGIGKIGSVEEVGLEHNSLMVEVNVLALTKICSICLPYIMNEGRIFNLASVAAFLPQSNFAVYAASKAYVLSYSRALNQELKDKQITVTAVCPNPIETEFFNYAGRKKQADIIKKMSYEDVDKVVKTAFYKSNKNKDISISSFMAQLIRLVSRIFPHTFILKYKDKLKL